MISGDYVSLGRIPERGGLEIIKNNTYLTELYQRLSSEGIKNIHINKGLIKEFKYYTGITFECSVNGFGRPLASGGRYDQLISKFGFDCPAVGFAISINDILILKQRGQLS